jgi:hypothetical protein
VFAPVLLKARNLPVELNEYGYVYKTYADWGYMVEFTFDQIIYNADVYPEDFKLEDDSGSIWYGQEASFEGRRVYVLFNNFNNAVNPITATGLAGRLWNGDIALEETSVQFNATGLVPYEVNPPVPVSIENIQDWSED